MPVCSVPAVRSGESLGGACPGTYRAARVARSSQSWRSPCRLGSLGRSRLHRRRSGPRQPQYQRVQVPARRTRRGHVHGRITDRRVAGGRGRGRLRLGARAGRPRPGGRLAAAGREGEPRPAARAADRPAPGRCRHSQPCLAAGAADAGVGHGNTSLGTPESILPPEDRTGPVGQDLSSPPTRNVSPWRGYSTRPLRSRRREGCREWHHNQGPGARGQGTRPSSPLRNYPASIPVPQPAPPTVTSN